LLAFLAAPKAASPGGMLEEMSRQVFRRLDLLAGMRVVDLGCGLGGRRARSSRSTRSRPPRSARWNVIGLGRRYFGYYLITARKR
jgi:hypothetical protein